MNVKAIILDIDGTLLNHAKVITERTKKALMNAQAKGIKVVLASGRPTRGMMKLVHELEMDKHHGLVVSYNGASVMDCETNEIIYNQAMSIDEAKAVLKHMKNFDVMPMFGVGDTMMVDNVYGNEISWNGRTWNAVEYEARGNDYRLCEPEHLWYAVEAPVNKILVAGDPQYLLNHYKAMAEPFVGKLNSMFTAAFYYEYTANGIDKANALHESLVKMGIEAHETIAFGDGHNDLSIIKFAGLGVAMANAVEDLKQAADEITLSNDEDGIAVIVERYL